MSAPAADGRDHRQIGAEDADRRIGGRELGERRMPMNQRKSRFARAGGGTLPEAMDVDIDQARQFGGEILDVYPGTAVDVRRVLAGQQRDTHDRSLWAGRESAVMVLCCAA